MSMNSRELVAASFERCDSHGSFTDVFYEILLGKSDEIRKHFKSTNFEKQKKLLRASVYILVLQDISSPKAQNILNKIGATHSKSQLNIPPNLYSIWLDSLCETLQKNDPEYDEVLESHWREIMREPIDYIVAQYT